MDNIQVMAFDFGANRIGVATGNTLLGIAHPLSMITGRDKFEKLAKIEILVSEWSPKLLLVGMPSSSEETAVLVRKFANRLRDRFKLPVEFINEDYTSSFASNLLDEQNIHGRKQVGFLDQLAAATILNTYFLNTQKS